MHTARSTRNSGDPDGVLPKIKFNGWTNLAHFDGHAAIERGTWLKKGEGGTVNPYWLRWGGKHTTYVWP